MKRTVLTVILVLCAFLGVYGQNTPMDVVLLLDTSTGMSPSYENVNNYITGSFLSEFLRVGDTFHLIAFSASPRLDVARRVASIGDVETIIGRMLLQYPVESGNNIGSAIGFAEQYAASLPERPKKIVMLSSTGDANNLAGAARQRLSSRNASFDFVQVNPGQPLANLPSSGRPKTAVAASTAPQRPATPPPAAPVAAPPPAVQQTAPVTSAQPSTVTQAAPPSAPQTTAQQTAPSTQPVTQAPPAVAPVESKPPAISEPAPQREPEQKREPAQASKPRQERSSGSGTSWDSSIPFIIGIVILALLILGVILLFTTRRLGSRPSRVVAEAASAGAASAGAASSAEHSKELAKYAASPKRRTTASAKQESVKPAEINPTGPLLLNLFVEDQNTAIGKRNIHSLKSGYSLSVGGGQSDFLIFLVPIPARIGEIRRNGSQCTFVPLKPEYFPDLGSNELKDCINKTIRVISDKNYELRFRFEMYEDPLIALNRQLLSIKVPG